MKWFRRRTMWWPTWRVWLLVMVAMVGMGHLAAPALYDLLSPRDDGKADVLVIEGWIPDFAVPEVLRRIESNPDARVVTTGGPVEHGGYLQEWRTYAEAARATLLAAGAPSGRVVAVPAPACRTDRTFASALALKRYLEESGVGGGRVSVVTLSVHARRSRALFQRALGGAFQVGSEPYESPQFGRRDWWRSSEGVRWVLSETIAAVHAWLCPPRPPLAMDEMTAGR
ncbi:MAG: YdcF family protein [Kiritimatiellae bacterium]|nr:YdcF family protein [Kiritimatiellia bacterium]